MKSYAALTLLGCTLGLASCTVTTVDTEVDYPNTYRDYVYDVDYYGYRPYWAPTYYTGHHWENHYWHGSRSFYYNRVW